MKKKVLIFLIVAVLLGGASYGSYVAYHSYKDENTVAKLQSVSTLNWGYYGSDMESSGVVTNDIAQQIYLSSDQTVEEVYVEEGQTVAVGDALLKYDQSTVQFSIQMKELDIETIKNDTAIANRSLTKLLGMTPIEEQEEKDTEEKDTTGEANTAVGVGAVPSGGDGSSASPFVFLCTWDAFVSGEYINQLILYGQVAQFDVRKGNVSTGQLLSTWKVDGTKLSMVDNDTIFYVYNDEDAYGTDTLDEQYEEETEEDTEIVTGYTKEELDKEIAKKKTELRDLDVKLRTAQLALTKLKKQAQDATVYASINGVVKSVQDVNNLSQDGKPFLSVTGSDGLYVKGQISELQLANVEVGMPVYLTSWQSGMMYDAVITEISEYPTEGSGGSYSSGNQNSSYYAFTSYIENSGELTNGESVSISISTANVAAQDAIYLEKAYVRKEDGKSYVLKEGADGRLQKQYVKTGKTVYGSAIEIKSGITLEDYIAFPYGKTAKEGVRTEREDAQTYG